MLFNELVWEDPCVFIGILQKYLMNKLSTHALDLPQLSVDRHGRDSRPLTLPVLCKMHNSAVQCCINTTKARSGHGYIATSGLLSASTYHRLNSDGSCILK